MGLFSYRGAHLELPKTPARLREALDAALQVSEIASSAVPLPQALQAILRIAVALLRADQGSIMLLDDGGDSLVLSATQGSPPEVEVGFRLSATDSVAGRVLATGRPLLLGDIDREQFTNFVEKSRPITSSAVVPLRAQGGVIGILSIAICAGDSEFTAEDLRVAQMFADQVAGVIYRARLHERAEQRSSDLMALVESNRGLVGTLDVDDLLQKLLDGSLRLTAASAGFSCLFDSETQAITRGVFRGFSKPTIRALLEHPDTRSALQTGELVVFEAHNLGTIVAAGFSTSQNTTGAIVVSADKTFFAGRDDLLRAFTQQCATALGAAELHSVVQRKESELAAIIDGVPNPIVLADARHNIVALNPAAEMLFHVSSTFSAGAPVRSTFGNEEVEQLLCARGDVQRELIVGNPPRTYKTRVTDVRLRKSLGGRVMVMDDVTFERQMNQVQHDFVAMIGHELRTPLTVIKGFAKTLLKRVDRASAEQMSEMLGTIDSKAAQLGRLIEDLLYVSRIESREAALRIERIDISSLVKSIAEELVAEHPRRELQLDVPRDLLWSCDESKVALVLRHLIDNALKYSDAPSPVLVRAADEGEQIRFDISDRGMGIISSEVPQIFERFRQVDSSSTRSHGGTGVGLYLCAQLVRVHGGRISVDSSWGKGSTFSFTLPRRAEPTEVVGLHVQPEPAETA